MRSWLRLLIAGVAGGLAFAVLDALVNVNPLAQRLLEAYRPILRGSVSPAAGTLVDLAWGLALAAIFAQLRASLPGRGRLAKGLSFGALVWLFRVAMPAASSALMFTIPPPTLAYQLGAGLLELLALGALYGFALGALRFRAPPASPEAACRY